MKKFILGLWFVACPVLWSKPLFFPQPQKIVWGGPVEQEKAFVLRAEKGVPQATIWEYERELQKRGFQEKEKGMALVIKEAKREQCEELALKEIFWPPYEQDIQGALEALVSQTYFLKAKKGEAVIEACGEEGFFYGLITFFHLFEEKEKKTFLWEARIEDYPRFPYRGILEGGYGIWDSEGRLSVLDWMGEVKLNTYVYGPKSDPKIRRQWRELYDDIELFQFKRMLERARENHIVAGYVISPPSGIEYGSEEDFQALLKKVRQLQSLGFRTFVLAFDDTMGLLSSPRDREQFENLADAEAYLANKLYQALKSYDRKAQLGFVPEIYAGVHRIPYTETLVKKLHPEIFIGWTGTEIVAPKIEPEDMKAFVQFYGKMPSLGDNWGTLFPLLGRKPQIFQYTTQFLVNPYNLQGEVPIPGMGGASEPELMPVEGASFSEFGWNPEAYDPDKTINTLISLYFEGEAQELFKMLMALEYYQFSSMLKVSYQPPFEKKIRELVARGDKGELLKALEELPLLSGDLDEAKARLERGAKNKILGEALGKRVKSYGALLAGAKEEAEKLREVVASQPPSAWSSAVDKLFQALRGKP